MEIASLEKVCRTVRRDIINMTADAASGHPGGSLSAVEIITTLFFDKMNIDPQNPKKADRDRFVLSKGHAAPCYNAVLGERGFFDKAEFKNFRQLHSFLQGHPDAKKCPGVDASTGSLGQGISIAVGMALGAKKLDHSDVKQWYTQKGIALLSALIDELNVQGHKRLTIKENGDVFVTASGKQQPVDTIPDFPPRPAWEDLCVLAREDDIAAEVCNQELTVSWA